MHDIIGHYNRFDVFQLHVNKAEQRAIHVNPGSATAQESITEQQNKYNTENANTTAADTAN
jgi:aliphatic nitrilase